MCAAARRLIAGARPGDACASRPTTSTSVPTSACCSACRRPRPARGRGPGGARPARADPVRRPGAGRGRPARPRAARPRRAAGGRPLDGRRHGRRRAARGGDGARRRPAGTARRAGGRRTAPTTRTPSTENFSGALPVSAHRSRSGVVGANVTLVRRDPDIEVVGEHGRLPVPPRASTPPGRGRRAPGRRSWGRVDVRGRRAARCGSSPPTPRRTTAPVRDAQRDEVLAAHGDGRRPGGPGRRPQRHTRRASGVPARLGRRLDRGDGDGSTCGQAADLANEREPDCTERIDYVWVRGARGVGAAVSSATEPGDRTTTEPSALALGPRRRASPTLQVLRRPNRVGSVLGPTPQRLGLAAALLAGQPALLGPAGRPGGAASRRRRRGRPR